MKKHLFATFALAALLLSTGCHSGAAGDGTAKPANVKIYKLRGKVISTDEAKGEVTLDHEAIPGFMEAMTMPYKLKDAGVIRELHPGDRLNADVVVSDAPDADVVLDHIVITAQARADYKPAVVYHVPATGELVPDFKLTNQNGKAVRLGQFRGKAVLLTFVYTRCPLPDFCPRMTHNFEKIQKQIAGDTALRGKAHLLSVSFDTKHDTPEALRKYAVSYLGDGVKFEDWEFVVPTEKELMAMAKFFDLGMSAEKDTTFTHTLSTTLIGPDGKVVQFYPGNEWTPDQVIADLRKLLR